jgi:hypothetical protein
MKKISYMNTVHISFSHAIDVCVYDAPLINWHTSSIIDVVHFAENVLYLQSLYSFIFSIHTTGPCKNLYLEPINRMMSGNSHIYTDMHTLDLD